ncbi:MAG TPA: 4-hydroxy-tetrahydrodipicolinate synthase [Chloroflexota bacterium]|nr:4-hydroxy-tetrahydrodipicolinate synthase [Chloroflexota bacterium]
MAAEIGRVVTAMATPFDDAGDVDYQRTRQLASALIASGSDALVVTGTTGESPTLSNEEKLTLYQEVRAAVGSNVPLIAGSTNYNTAESIELSREAARLGMDAILGTVPYYNKPPQEGLYQHFKALAEAVPLPMILYNVPTRTVTNMSFETTIRLSEIDNIIGIKEASGNLEGIAKIIAGSRPGFRVWSGDDPMTLPILSIGGYGVVSVASHLVGNQIKEMTRRFIDGDVGDAAAMHRNMLPLVNALFVTTSPIPLKYALGRVGFPIGACRLPLVNIDTASAAIVDAELMKVHIDLPVTAIV